MDCIIITLDSERRVKFYKEGGVSQERCINMPVVSGPSRQWFIAWDEDWTDDLRVAIARATAGLANLEIVEGV